MTARRPLLVAAAVLLWAGQASAATVTPHWYDAGAGLPTTVNLNDVAVDSATGVVVAVGQNTDTAGGTTAPAPVVYRLAQGAWQADTIIGVPTDATAAELDRVAVAGGRAWVIGSYTSGSADATITTPLVLHFDGTDLTAATGSWSAATGTPAALTRPTAIGLAALPSNGGADGFIGDASGALFGLDDPATGTPTWSTVSEPTVPGPITDVAALGPESGLAVAAATTDNKPRFLGLAADPVTATQMDATPQPALTDLTQSPVGVAASDTATALAIDAARPWQPGSGGSWSRDTSSTAFGLSATTLTDVTAYKDANATATFAIAGSNLFGPAVWRRTGTGAWATDNNDADDTLTGTAPVSAVAITSPSEMWAVGSAGCVLHFWPKPPPPPQPDPNSDPGTGTDPGTGGTDPSLTDTTGTEPAAAPADVSESAPAPAVTVVTQPPATKLGAKPKKPSRKAVMSNVALKRVKRGLRLTFTLSAPARVSATALLGKKVVAKSKPARFKRGAGSLLVPYRGKKPPTKLKIVVKPVAK